jgi:Ca2+-binding EF-hand superfamily protein
VGSALTGAESALLDSRTATSLLLDLGVRGEALGRATQAMESMSESAGPGETLLDFPTFLQHYAHVTGLGFSGGAQGSSSGGGNDKEGRAALLWVPTATGMWAEADYASVSELMKAAVPYSTTHPAGESGSPSQLEQEISHHLANMGSDLWVRSDDVTDILLLSGLNQSETVVGETTRVLRALLMGMSTGKMCFQEVLAVYMAVKDVSSGGGGGMAAGGGTTTADGDATRATRGAFSKSARPQHDAEKFKDPLAGGRDESIGSRVTMQDFAPRTSDTVGGEREEDAAAAGWRLPFRSTTSQVPRSRISTEFRRLDILGEGRLNFLSLKSALELREVDESDSSIRQWLKESDRGDKGYVTFEDYEAIYEEAKGGGAPVGVGTTSELKRYGTLDAGRGDDYTASRSRASAMSKQGVSVMPATSESARAAALERSMLLKRAFNKYDVDGDGFISVHDLETAFRRQGRNASHAEVVSWVRRKDMSNIGAVCLEDFLASYGK